MVPTSRSMVPTSRSSYHDLCEDIIVKILLLLPVLSLVRFRSVCKLWHSIICGPRFIEIHLAISNRRQASALSVARVVRGGDQEEDWTFDEIYIDTCEDSFKVHWAPHWDLLIGSCNGLVCVSNNECDRICLWNPSIKQYKILPAPKNRSNCERSIIGFGFDPISSDYKFLRIVFPNAGRSSGYYVHCIGELYSANADSWTEVKLPKVLQVKTMKIMMYSPCFNARAGVLYEEGVDKLLLFDLHNEVFKVYPYPESVKPKGKTNVLDLNGSVAMIFKSVNDTREGLSLWTIEEDVCCGKVSWTKKFNLDTDLVNKEVYLYLGAGQFVIDDGGDAGYTIYDYKKKENKEFALPAHSTCILSTVKYSESLVSLEGFKPQEYSGKREKECGLFTCYGQKLLSFSYY